LIAGGVMAYRQPGREPSDALQQPSQSFIAHCRLSAKRQLNCGRVIDVHTGAGNFLNGAIPNQDIVAVSSGGDDGGSGWFGEGELSGQKASVFRGSGFRSLRQP
jgi:hypothetical protein